MTHQLKPAMLTLLASLTLSAWAAENPVEEEKVLRKRLAAQPQRQEARYALARLLSRSGRHDEALVEYGVLLQVAPNNADYLLGMAQTHVWRGQPAKASALLHKAKQLAPDYADVWHLQIQALLAIGAPDGLLQARSIRDEARRRFPLKEWNYAALDHAPSAPPSSGAHATSSAADLSEPPSTPPPEAMQPLPPPLPGTPADEAQDATALPGKHGWEAGIAHASLSNHLPPWRLSYLQGEWRMGATQFYGGVRQTERYRLDDREAHLGTVLRLNTTHQLQLEAGASDTHHVLPMRYGAIHWHLQPAPAWLLTAGLRHSRYESASTDVYSLGGEHYVGAERFAYTLFAGGPSDSSLTASHRLQWTHHYHDTGWITLSLLRGKESEYAAPTGLLTSRVSGRALHGQHGIAPGWAIVWAIEYHRQGDLHTRNGVQIGIRHDY